MQGMWACFTQSYLGQLCAVHCTTVEKIPRGVTSVPTLSLLYQG